MLLYKFQACWRLLRLLIRRILTARSTPDAIDKTENTTAASQHSHAHSDRNFVRSASPNAGTYNTAKAADASPIKIHKGREWSTDSSRGTTPTSDILQIPVLHHERGGGSSVIAFLGIVIRSMLLLEHDVIRKPVPTFRHHALVDALPLVQQADYLAGNLVLSFADDRAAR